MPINKTGNTGKRDETMGYVKWSYETLNHFCGDVFKAFGFTEEESNQITDEELSPEYIIPKAFDKRVGPAVAKAVAEAAKRTGVARI